MLAHDVGVGIHGIRLVVDLAAPRVQSPPGGLIDQVVPVAVEARDGAAINSDQKGLEGLLAGCWSRRRQASEHQDAPKNNRAQTSCANRRQDHTEHHLDIEVTAFLAWQASHKLIWDRLVNAKPRYVQ